MNPDSTHTWLMYNENNVLVGLSVDEPMGDEALEADDADDLELRDRYRELLSAFDTYDCLLDTIRASGRLELVTKSEGRARARFIGEPATPVTTVPTAPPTVIIQMLGGSISSITHNLESRTQYVLLDHETDNNSERDESIILDGQRVESAIIYGEHNPHSCTEILELARAAKAAAVAAQTAHGETNSSWPTEHPDHPLSDWRREVGNGDTCLGYTDWLEHRLDANI